MTEKMINVEEKDSCQPLVKLISEGISNAIQGLSQMVGKEISISNLFLRQVPIKDVSSLFGGPEALLVGVYLKVYGYDDGHMIVVYEPDTAFKLIDTLLSQSPGSTTDLSEMEISVLGEVGNVMGSFFLNVIANGTGITLQPSPPAVMMDMAGAILDVPLAQMLEHSDDTLIAETTFSTDDFVVNGKFLVVPVPTNLNT
jgi:chemotaxis protein CheC